MIRFMKSSMGWGILFWLGVKAAWMGLHGLGWVAATPYANHVDLALFIPGCLLGVALTAWLPAARG